MPSKVRIVKWEPPRESLVITTQHGVPEPEKLAGIAVVKLQRELLGIGCGCHEPAELIGMLRDLGVEVEIIEGETANASN